jgi:RNA polymerase-binding transcription factor DksA
MADPADIGNATAAFCTAEAERHQRALAQPEAQPNFNEFDGLNCVDCGEEIISERLAMGRVRCAECQTTLEWETKVGRH